MSTTTALKHIVRWTHPSHYSGAEYYEYYLSGFGQSRDSDILEQSNFAVALERLGGESKCDCDDPTECRCEVIVARVGHWACGWVECILIHESATDKLEIADQLRVEYEAYPVLDEDDHSERESEYYAEYAEQSKDSLAEALSVHFHVKNGKALVELAYSLQMNCQYNNGPDSCVDIYDMRKPDRRDVERLKRLFRDMEYSYAKSRVFKQLKRAVDTWLEVQS